MKIKETLVPSLAVSPLDLHLLMHPARISSKRHIRTLLIVASIRSLCAPIRLLSFGFGASLFGLLLVQKPRKVLAKETTSTATLRQGPWE